MRDASRLLALAALLSLQPCTVAVHGGGARVVARRPPTVMRASAASSKGFGAPAKRAPKRAAERPPPRPAAAQVRRVRKGQLSPMRVVPAHIPRPDYAATGSPGYRRPVIPWDIEAKGPEAIAGMRAACALARDVLDAAGKAIAPGLRLDEIDRIVHEEVRPPRHAARPPRRAIARPARALCVKRIGRSRRGGARAVQTIARGAYPSTLNYHGYPKSVCTSVNGARARRGVCRRRAPGRSPARRRASARRDCVPRHPGRQRAARGRHCQRRRDVLLWRVPRRPLRDFCRRARRRAGPTTRTRHARRVAGGDCNLRAGRAVQGARARRVRRAPARQSARAPRPASSGLRATPSIVRTARLSAPPARAAGQAIGAAIEEVVAPSGFSIVRGFVGHGIGHAFHMPPNVVHLSLIHI